MKPICIALLLASSVALFPQLSRAGTAQISGVIFADRNGNGLREASERGVPGVQVSNGVEIVSSDAKGRYLLSATPGQIIFVIKPAAYGVGKLENGMPAFWHKYQPVSGPALKYGGLSAGLPASFDFALHATNQSRSESTRVLVFADPQPKQMTDVGYYRDDVVADVRQYMAKQKTPFVLGTSLGDIVNDDLSLYPAMNTITASMGVPWLHIPGNHDIDMDAADDAHALDTYRNTYGPDTFAWHERDFSFIGLDNVLWRGASNPGYIGGLREDQLSFLRAFLATLPEDRMLVLGMHIPLFEAEGRDTFRDADRKALFDLLSRFKNVLILSAHNHTQQHIFHDRTDGWVGATPLHEFNVGAVCGAFWSGVKDAQGIPQSTMADGTPNGWATLEIEKSGRYSLDWHAARDARRPAMHLSAPRVLRKGAYPAWGLYANAYMAAADAKVEFQVDGAKWKSMQRVRRPDPDLLAENVRDDAAPKLRGYDRSPEAQNVEHLWRAALPTDLSIGTHVVTVRYIDVSGRTHTATRDYALQEASP